MALVVEDGSIVAGANSYVSLADADAYLANALTASVWTALTDPAKEALLIAASRWLDQQAVWHGYKVDADSAMRWPRSGVCDRDNLPVAEDEIPQQLMEAVMELALFFATPENDPTRYADLQGFEEITVDVITLRFAQGYDATTKKLLPGLNTMLRGLGGVSFGGRGFAPIVRV